MSLSTDTPIQYLKGVGPRLGAMLSSRGIHTVGELLEWYPRAYEDRRAARSISSLQEGEIVSIKAKVLALGQIPLGRTARRMWDILVGDENGRIHCKFFRVPYKGYFERFKVGTNVRVIGKVTCYRGRLEFHHPDMKDIEEDEEQSDALVPLYTETEGLSVGKVRKLISSAISFLETDETKINEVMRLKNKNEYYKQEAGDKNKIIIPESLPAWIRQSYNLPLRALALKNIHQPPYEASLEFIELKSRDHRRIIFEEFFWLELYLASRKAGVQKENAPSMMEDYSLVKKLETSLPFALTGAQQRAFADIAKDLIKPHPMHRLIQGDVGSGKTLVAMMAVAFAKQSGMQAAIMVPTEILAEQHFRNSQKLLIPLGIKVGLLTGKMKSKEKREMIEALKSGEIDFCIGTHALIQDEVEFLNLGLVIVDEQHRFGVHQRSSLKQKGESPHFLVMTATPIPRTLAMTVYGDLDVSVIDELPKGRSPIQTRVTYESKRQQMLEFLREQILKGRQGYVVYPLVEESEKIDLKDALSEFENLKSYFPDFKVGLLHGRMKQEEKDEVMNQFRQAQIQILVSTTVIEVGVDVPNANIMVVEHAERFGLSQLHQLRGRVGRGQHKSFCILMLGHAVSEESFERSRIMEQTSDGFKIAEADLEIRGPGEFLGARQSGLPGFKLANLVRDVVVLQEAREAAFEVLRRDPNLQMPEHQGLREILLKQHGPAALASVG